MYKKQRNTGQLRCDQNLCYSAPFFIMKKFLMPSFKSRFYAEDSYRARLLEFKETLLSIDAEELLALLMPLARIYKSTDKIEYKIASLFLLADVYSKICIREQQKGTLKAAYEAYVGARDSLEKAKEILDDKQVNALLIKSLTTQNTSDPEEALMVLKSLILPSLETQAEAKITTHIAIKI